MAAPAPWPRPPRPPRPATCWSRPTPRGAAAPRRPRASTRTRLLGEHLRGLARPSLAAFRAETRGWDADDLEPLEQYVRGRHAAAAPGADLAARLSLAERADWAAEARAWGDGLPAFYRGVLRALAPRAEQKAPARAEAEADADAWACAFLRGLPARAGDLRLWLEEDAALARAGVLQHSDDGRTDLAHWLAGAGAPLNLLAQRARRRPAALAAVDALFLARHDEADPWGSGMRSAAAVARALRRPGPLAGGRRRAPTLAQ